MASVGRLFGNSHPNKIMFCWGRRQLRRWVASARAARCPAGRGAPAAARAAGGAPRRAARRTASGGYIMYPP